MSRFVRVKNNEVVEFWDVESTLPSPVGTNGWVDAVERIPAILPGRQAYGVYTYDTRQDPVVISREVIDISIDDRKQTLIDNNKQQFLHFASLVDKGIYTTEEITENKKIAKYNEDVITAATSHDELDAIVLKTINLF